ncbi:hypothetical protein Salat_0204800 [Sesamum alatum]|uniref:Uncharacterized protein n=1 Tax=Sesamum alatum TaxID=300844 RepID=A0AAE1YZN6_9LAMI|nr:hypothetical protein Salat_0204800 [Sesamum alatum]
MRSQGEKRSRPENAPSPEGNPDLSYHGEVGYLGDPIPNSICRDGRYASLARRNGEKRSSGNPAMGSRTWRRSSSCLSEEKRVILETILISLLRPWILWIPVMRYCAVSFGPSLWAELKPGSHNCQRGRYPASNKWPEDLYPTSLAINDSLKTQVTSLL